MNLLQGGRQHASLYTSQPAYMVAPALSGIHNRLVRKALETGVPINGTVPAAS